MPETCGEVSSKNLSIHHQYMLAALNLGLLEPLCCLFAITKIIRSMNPLSPLLPAISFERSFVCIPPITLTLGCPKANELQLSFLSDSTRIPLKSLIQNSSSELFRL